MTDDIVARLRQWSDNAKEQDATDVVVGLCQAADEIERLRGQIEHHARDRIEYCAAWSKWIEENDGLEIAQWCRAYADAVPYPNPDGPEIVRVIYSRLDARHRMAAAEIERLRELSGDAGQLRAERDEARAEARRLRSSVCLGAPSRTTVGWSCFKEATDGSR